MINKKNFKKFENLEETGKPRVLFFGGNVSASGYYRILSIAEKLAERNNFEIDVVDQKDYENTLFRIGHSDILVFQLQSNALIRDIIKVCRARGIKVVLDMDDDLLNVPKHNPAYRKFGRERCSYWEGEKPMDLMANLQRLKILKEIAKEVDIITVTGEGLRNRYSRFNKIRVLPNVVDYKKITGSPKSWEAGGKIRIFWQGSSTHFYDLKLLEKVIPTLSQKYPKVEWNFWGGGVEEIRDLIPLYKKQIKVHKPVTMDRFYKKLNKKRMDIGICPLQNDAFNRCKSNLKWLEYSLCGVPTVASDVSIYSKDIINGFTGFIAKNDEDWIQSLSKLIENKMTREIVANAAKSQVLRDFNIHTKIELWEDMLNKLMKKNA